MKHWLMRVLLLLALPVFGQQSVPEIPFDADPNFLKLPPSMYFGEGAGVAVNSKGHVFVYSRGSTVGPVFGAAAAQLLEFGKDGTFIREIGKNLYAFGYAHAVRIDRHDNIWIADKGSDMVVEFNPAGRVLMVLGRKQEPSEAGAKPWPLEEIRSGHVPPPVHQDGRFRQPTDVAWDQAGNIYISDGYVNSRVAKIDKNGDWITSWGRRGKEDGEFNTVHGIGVDNNGNVYVADRNNRRIQVFDGDGKHLRNITIDIPYDPKTPSVIGNRPDLNAPDGGGLLAPGAPWTICITPGPNQVLYTSDAWPGRIYKISLDGKLLGMLGRAGKQPKQFGWVHALACPSENELYAAEVVNWRVQRLLLHPSGATQSKAQR